MASTSSWTPPAPDAVPAPTVPAVNDRHTLSSIASELYSTHLHIDWDIDWENKLISGSVEHSFHVPSDGKAHEEVVFDSSYLKVQRVLANGQEVQGWKIDERRGQLGSALRVPLQKDQIKEGLKIKIEYSTTEHCTALGWLTKE